MRDSRKTLVTGTIPSPESFRAMTTGIGQSQAMSLRTGAIRAQEVANDCSPECAKALPASYPSPMRYEVPMPGESEPDRGISSKPAKVATTFPKKTNSTSC